MPRKPKHPCAYPGCPKLTYDRYCDEHKRKERSTYNKYERDTELQAFYNSPAWKMARKRQLDAVPYCEECRKEGRITKAVLVDHIKPIREGGDRYAASNLQSLCWQCHSRKSIIEGSRYGKRK